jgi:hypothetical protein
MPKRGPGRPFQKGQSPNPRGRPRGGTSVAEYIRGLAGPHARAYIDHLHSLAVEPHGDVKTRIAAIEILLERGWGKPPQDVNLGGQETSPVTVIHQHIHEGTGQ